MSLVFSLSVFVVMLVAVPIVPSRVSRLTAVCICVAALAQIVMVEWLGIPILPDCAAGSAAAFMIHAKQVEVVVTGTVPVLLLQVLSPAAKQRWTGCFSVFLNVSVMNNILWTVPMEFTGAATLAQNLRGAAACFLTLSLAARAFTLGFTNTVRWTLGERVLPIFRSSPSSWVLLYTLWNASFCNDFSASATHVAAYLIAMAYLSRCERLPKGASAAELFGYARALTLGIYAMTYYALVMCPATRQAVPLTRVSYCTEAGAMGRTGTGSDANVTVQAALMLACAYDFIDAMRGVRARDWKVGQRR